MDTYMFLTPTWKMALKDSKMSPEKKIMCSGNWKTGKYTFENYQNNTVIGQLPNYMRMYFFDELPNEYRK